MKIKTQTEMEYIYIYICIYSLTTDRLSNNADKGSSAGRGIWKIAN